MPPPDFVRRRRQRQAQRDAARTVEAVRPPTCFIVHGWESDDSFGAGNVQRLAMYVETKGYEVETYRWRARWYSALPATVAAYGLDLAAEVCEGDVAVCFSTGAAICHAATRFWGARFSTVALISPNLARDAVFPTNGYLKRIFVWHSQDDEVLAKTERMPLPPLSTFGDMGRVGYQGNDPRVVNFDKQRCYAMQSKTHMDLFNDRRLFAFFAPRIVAHLPVARAV